MIKNTKTKRVVIGLSGGVDSAVSAYLLKRAGYEVIAVFMQNWDDYLNNNVTSTTWNCTQSQDWRDAQAVAEEVKIPLFRTEFVKEYWEEVFQKFLTLVKKGRTPNPDILCNKVIKFNYFFEYVEKKFSPSFIATGHYADLKRRAGELFLEKARDEQKDQTYFLCQIKRQSLSKVIFPLGELRKEEVRKIAEEIGLSNYQKKDSVGLCFVGEQRRFGEFLANYIPWKSGDIVDLVSKEKLGTHNGHHNFTIGQRRNLFVTRTKLHQADGFYYVAAKDVKKNVIYVIKDKENHLLYNQWCAVTGFNRLVSKVFFAEAVKKGGITGKFRHRNWESEVRIILEKDDFKTFKVFFETKEKCVTPGQYAVLYSENTCLGGGVIEETDRLDKNSKPRL